jgi:pantoate--beta-alanine ligase
MYGTRGLGRSTTVVAEEELTKGMEGASRPTHFRGVTTVVAKLFNVVGPDVAVFGAKDYQQAAVVGRMARDLFFPVKVVVSPTVRERDGLALSSRNAYLSGEERREAVVLYEALRYARRRVRAAQGRVSAVRLREAVVRLVAGRAGARLDYVAFVDPETLAPLQRVGRGARMALAVWLGKTRLIDNGRL